MESTVDSRRSTVRRRRRWSEAVAISVWLATFAATAVPRARVDRTARRAEAEKALRTGRYDDARKLADDLHRSDPADTRAPVIAARADLARGRHEDARRRLEEAAARAPADLPLRGALLEVLETVNDRPAMAPLIERTYEDWASGRVDKQSAPDLVAVSIAVRLDNNWRDAKDTLDDAAKVSQRWPDASLELGRILLEKYEAGYAEIAFRKVLKIDPAHPDAHVGLARVLLEQSYDTAAADKELAAALAVNPQHAGALAIRATIALDAEDFAGAATLVATIRRTNPRDAEAAWIASARDLLLDDRAGWERERKARLAVRAGDAEFFERVSRALDRHRRYDQSRAIAEEGVATDERHGGCLAALGTTLLRLGDEAAGLDALRRAWKRDPYNVRTFNLLNLFEKVIPARYVTVATAHLRFRIEPKARLAIESVVAPFLEETYSRYVRRYGFEPAGPIMFELYGDPQHYAARTVGTPVLGVAGVCFGRVITSQAPTNQAFNWGMVLAHELAHVFAIQLSKSRVPRWFTEGLSEVETMRARPEWERHNDVDLWAARKAGTLPTLVDLSNAFVRARNIDDATRAYMHAAVAMDFLERRFGFARIREALVAYGRGERGAPVLERLAGMKVDALEKEFRAELDRRLSRYDPQFLPTHTMKLPRDEAEKRAAARPGDPAALAQAGLAQLAAGDRLAAESSLAKARAVRALKETDDAPLVMFLAGEIELASMQAESAAAMFGALIHLGHDGYDVRVRAALAAVHRKDPAAAEAHLRRAVTLDPSRVEPHALLAELLEKTGRMDDRLAALEAALRLEPQSSKLAKQLVLGNARAGRPGRVIDLAPIAVFIDPADPDIHAAHGRALAATARTAEAVQALERALLFAPADPADLHRTLAGLYDKLGDRAKANHHRNAATPDPNRGQTSPSPAPATTKPWVPPPPMTAPRAKSPR